MYPSVSEALGDGDRPRRPPSSCCASTRPRSVSRSDGKASGTGSSSRSCGSTSSATTSHVPTFVRDFPVETSPLTREHRTAPGVAEKWDLYVRGFELATGYSELVDAVVERERLTEQASLRPPATTRPCVLTRTFCGHWSTECRPAAASEWGSTGC